MTEEDWAECCRELQNQVDALRVKLAELEAPPVVPAGGWEVDRMESGWFWLSPPGHEYNEATTQERKAEADTVRALAWAIEHNARPPHAADEKGGVR